MVQPDSKMRAARSAEATGEVGDRLPFEPSEIIRTETILSKLPIHQLAKRGSVPIRITRTTAGGKVELQWEVHPNPAIGEPRALAYKLDTIVINRRLDEIGKPFRRLLKLGSERSIARQLGLGGDTAKVKRALLQNAATLISAKFTYKTAGGEERQFESWNTRYGVYFWRSTLPDGTKSDSVYLSFNDPFYQLLQEAPRRPLDYEYLKALPPAAQRFYELVSYQIYATIKNGLPAATISYSEYCTFACQSRFDNRDDMQAQMARVHRPHKAAGYIASVAYQPTTDDQGKPDWILSYRPGPKAWGEFNAFNKNRRSSSSMNAVEPEQGTVHQLKVVESPAPDADADVDEELLKALTDCGVYEPQARKILAGIVSVDDLEHLNDCIEYWHGIPDGKKGPGLLHHLVTSKEALPSTFETRRQRREREDAKRARQAEKELESALERDYQEYQAREVDAFIARTHSPEQLAARVAKKGEELVAEKPHVFGSWSADTLQRTAERAVRSEAASEASLMSFEAFRQQQTAERSSPPRSA